MEELKENSQDDQKDAIKLINTYNKSAIPLKNQYTIKQKLNAVKESNLTSIHPASNKYGIDRASIRD